MVRIAVLVSGGGTNLQALIDAQSRGELKNGRIAAVLSSRPDAYALERAAHPRLRGGPERLRLQPGDDRGPGGQAP